MKPCPSGPASISPLLRLPRSCKQFANELTPTSLSCFTPFQLTQQCDVAKSASTLVGTLNSINVQQFPVCGSCPEKGLVLISHFVEPLP